MFWNGGIAAVGVLGLMAAGILIAGPAQADGELIKAAAMFSDEHALDEDSLKEVRTGLFPFSAEEKDKVVLRRKGREATDADPTDQHRGPQARPTDLQINPFSLGTTTVSRPRLQQQPAQQQPAANNPPAASNPPVASNPPPASTTVTLPLGLGIGSTTDSIITNTLRLTGLLP